MDLSRRIPGFPAGIKLFLGLFATLVLGVCVWAVWIYTVEKGGVDPSDLPAYMSEEAAETATHDSLVAENPADNKTRLRHNLGLAHVHVNGQSLLFFALGAVYLFTSVKLRTKKIVLITFGISILVHAVGLSGEGFHWFFDDILAVSGVVMLALIAYMCLMIYVDLGRSRRDKRA